MFYTFIPMFNMDRFTIKVNEAIHSYGCKFLASLQIDLFLCVFVYLLIEGYSYMLQS